MPECILRDAGGLVDESGEEYGSGAGVGVAPDCGMSQTVSMSDAASGGAAMLLGRPRGLLRVRDRCSPTGGHVKSWLR